jgi:hypothetical protein
MLIKIRRMLLNGIINMETTSLLLFCLGSDWWNISAILANCSVLEGTAQTSYQFNI